MAVTKTEYLVNGGNTGWSKSDVISALETAFAGLGWHSGTAKTGVPTACLAPGSSQPIRDGGTGNFRYATPDLQTEYSRYERYYDITNDGGSSHWKVTRRENVQYIYGSNYAGNEGWVRLYDCNDLATGTAMVYRAGANTVPNRDGTSDPMFVDGQTYYVVNIDQDDWVRFADSASDAIAGTYIMPQSGAYSGDYGKFEQDLGNNPTLTVRMGDTLYFNNNSVGHPLYIQDQSGAYDSSRTLDTNNFRSLTYRDFPSNQGIEVGELTWQIDSWAQGDYYYVCQSHSAMNGIIRVLPSTNAWSNFGNINSTTYDDQLAYWDYTVPAGGVPGKTDLQLRIRKQNPQYGINGRLDSIEIMNEATGWSEDESFTIPGSAIGGVSPTNDIVFGTNSLTTQQQNDANGVCSLKVTNVGAGSNFYQKYSDGGILRLEHDAGKTFGHVYYGFRMKSNNDYQIYIGGNVDWKFRNYYPGSSDWNRQGEWGGQIGMDIPSYGYHLDNADRLEIHNYASSSTPTSYPLKIVTHQATSPQDTNFATITFVQTINSIDYAYLTWSPLKGASVGSGIWDLDYVWNGTYLTISPQNYGNDENIRIRTNYPWTYNAANELIGDTDTVRREAFYGFRRDPDASGTYIYYWEDNYSNNIHEYQSNNVAQKLGYYRNSTYDYTTINEQNNTTGNLNEAITNISVDPAANYYRPFKGIPMNTNMMPCPYYLPDDFTLIQFAVTPGATAFRTGDTITVSAGEVYEIIQVNYTTNQTASDNISGNTSKGIAFCARTT